jgi:hypothetical protein
MSWQTTNHKSNTTAITLDLLPTTLENENSVLKVWNKYKQEHSQSALMRDWQQNVTNTNPRKFAVGYYSCPLQAGNRLHHFFNSLVWAVVTNRTLLWKYYDRTTCMRVGILHDPGICESANTEKDFANVLERAEWLPSFHEWISKWNITSGERLEY